jgi:class 3 adenylate cyclase
LTRTGDTERRLVAIFAANVESYSRLTSLDEAGTIEGLTERRAIPDKLIAVHMGRMANTAGNRPGPASCDCGQRTDGFTTFGGAPIAAQNIAVGGRR